MVTRTKTKASPHSGATYRPQDFEAIPIAVAAHAALSGARLYVMWELHKAMPAKNLATHNNEEQQCHHESFLVVPRTPIAGATSREVPS